MLNKDVQNINKDGCNESVLNADKSGQSTLPDKKRILLFLICLIGIFVFTLLASLFVKDLPKDRQDGAAGLIAYAFLFVSMITLLGKDLIPGLKQFKNWKAIVYGFIGGAVLMCLTNGLSSFINLFYQTGDNVNQETLNSTIYVYPVASILIFGFIGPCCEELGYRVGLFGGLKKVHPVLAYVITSILFGLIHMSFSGDLTNELLNLPVYMFSGLILSYLYDKYGFATSYIAHALNNIVVILLILSGVNK